jgi:hypothetical protein
MPCRLNILFLCIGLCCLLATTNPKTINYYFTPAIAEGTPATNATLYVSVGTDSAKYAVGNDITILGNVSDARGNKVGAVISLQIAHTGNNPQVSASVYAKNGSFHYVVPAIEPVGNYNVTAKVVGQKGGASAIFNVVYPPMPYVAIIVGSLSFAGFISVLLLPWRRKDDDSYLPEVFRFWRRKDDDFASKGTYLPEVIRFLSLTGIAFTIVSFFLYIDLQYAINSPVGLVIKHSSGNDGGITEWVINVGGSKSNNYSSGLQIPFYVFALGMAGGYLRYLYKAAFKFEDAKRKTKDAKRKTKDAKREQNSSERKDEYQGLYQSPDTPQEFMWESIGELSEIVLSPFLAVAAWFLLSISTTPYIYTVALVSFTVGLVTKDIVHRLTEFTRSTIKHDNKNAND